MLPTIERPPRRSRYSSAIRYPAAGPPVRLRGPATLRPVEEARKAAGVPLASRSATRVSARSTLTSTCFFNLIQSFGIGKGRAPRVWTADERARCRWVRARPTGGRRHRGTMIGARAETRRRQGRTLRGAGGLAGWRGVLGGHWCLVAQYAALQRLRGARLDVDRLQQAHRQQGGDHRRAAVAHERQRDAGNWHDPNGHSHVDENLEHQHSRYADRKSVV